MNPKIEIFTFNDRMDIPVVQVVKRMMRLKKVLVRLLIIDWRKSMINQTIK
jgi:hypothetical protein